VQRVRCHDAIQHWQLERAGEVARDQMEGIPGSCGPSRYAARQATGCLCPRRRSQPEARRDRGAPVGEGAIARSEVSPNSPGWRYSTRKKPDMFPVIHGVIIGPPPRLVLFRPAETKSAERRLLEVGRRGRG
jgi:hypothetical protein